MIEQLKKEIEERIKQFKIETDRLQNDFENSIEGLAKKGYKIDKEQITGFMNRFWFTYQKNPDEWEVAIPVFIPFNIGWFDRTEGGYNIFVINKYTKWLGEEIPAFILHETNLPPPLNISIDGKEITFDEEKQEKIEKLFGEHLTLIEKNKASVKQGHEFDLIAEIIDSGSLPFRPNPILESDLMESDFTKIWDEMKEKYSQLEIFEGKYSYQGDAWKMFEKYGAVGIFWAMSFGKTVIGTYIFSRVVGKKALVVPTITLKDQWEEFFKRNCPRLLSEVEIYTYQGMSRKSWIDLQKKEFSLIGFDEAHFLPADTFSKLSTIRTKYRFGLSGTPYREDGKTNLILALTGFPIGLDWKTIMQVLGKTYHMINVHIVKDLESKFALTKQLYNPERRTLFFVNLINIGKRISEQFEIPFISGETKNRLQKIKESKSFVASRVLELGVSIKDLEHIIEVDFLFGSRREEVQRTGRLMHSEATGKVHDIIMTKDELEQHGKRLYGLYEKGFRYKLIPHLLGVQAPNAEKEKTVRPIAKGGLSYVKVIDTLFSEGYFQEERTLAEVVKSLERRGVSTGSIRRHIRSKLVNLVKSRKLFKIECEGSFKFKSRE